MYHNGGRPMLKLDDLKRIQFREEGSKDIAEWDTIYNTPYGTANLCQTVADISRTVDPEKITLDMILVELGEVYGNFEFRVV
jgi:hypothetical protein